MRVPVAHQGVGPVDLKAPLGDNVAGVLQVVAGAPAEEHAGRPVRIHPIRPDLGRERHGGRHEDPGELEGGEEDDQGKEVEKEFHASARRGGN